MGEVDRSLYEKDVVRRVRELFEREPDADARAMLNVLDEVSRAWGYFVGDRERKGTQANG